MVLASLGQERAKLFLAKAQGFGREKRGESVLIMTKGWKVEPFCAFFLSESIDQEKNNGH